MSGVEEMDWVESMGPERPENPKGKILSRVPHPGCSWNPLMSFPRNAECPCGSGSKFKKCCLSKIPPVLDASAKTDDLKRFVHHARESRK